MNALPFESSNVSENTRRKGFAALALHEIAKNRLFADCAISMPPSRETGAPLEVHGSGHQYCKGLDRSHLGAKPGLSAA
jgi:hypothetical protein